jgi:PKD repeat protein
LQKRLNDLNKLKTKKPEMSVRELFGSNLGNAEVVPDASVNAQLMKRLARREFIHFIPGRFNIYYLGGILFACILAGIILFSSRGNDGKLTPPELPEEQVKSGSNSYITIPAAPIPGQDTAKTDNRIRASMKNDVRRLADTETVEHTENNIEPWNENIIVPAGVRDSFPKILLPGTMSVTKKLQGIKRKEDALFEPSAFAGCVPLKVLFSNNVITCDSCRWTFGDGGYSTQMDPEWIFDVEGEYQVVLQVYGPGGQQTASSATIIVYPKPLARFEITPDRAVLPDDQILFLNYSANCVKFRWDFGDGNTSELFEPQHRYSKYNNYNVRLVVTSENGCSDSLTLLNAFSGSEYFIDFPNAFIPNTEGPSGGFYSSKSDEAAQIFHPAFSGVSDYHLKIFSKLGILIFESNDVNIGWDGYFKGRLSNPGIYIWKVRGNFRNGEPFTRMGDLILLKN